jgi:prevent-host-death family protein
MTTITASDLKQNSMRLQDALRDDLLVTKRDKPFVVVMDYEKYIKLQAYIDKVENEPVVDDGYPSISFDEASARVADAVDRYKSGKGNYTELDNTYWESLDALIDNAKGTE